jgi:hypothetical protein
VNAIFLLENGSKYFVQIMRIKYDLLFFRDFSFIIFVVLKREGVITVVLACSTGNNARKFKIH